MLPRVALLAAAMTVLAVPDRAAAFCGFYVAGADSKLSNHATVVVLMRDGNRTVLSMQNNYQGPPEKFAMIVPVPVVLKQDDVKTLPAELFDRLDRLTAPRLVEYWEQDPCTARRPEQDITGSGSGAGFGGRGIGGPPVTVEAQFAVGEYDIVILGAEDALALETWLTTNGYVIPAGAAEHLRPYVASGSKFFVARVDPARVKFDARGMATLSPLRMHYPSDDFRLPIRLGLINADGPQDLIIHILAQRGRFEAANYPNVILPSELLVKDEIRDTFPAFYAGLFDGLLARTPGAVITEYAWDARSCDPCPDPPLGSVELSTLGMDVLFDGTDSTDFPAIVQGKVSATGPLAPDAVRRFARGHINDVRRCYNQQLAANASAAATFNVDFTVRATGEVDKATIPDSGIDPTLAACTTRAIEAWTFPKTDAPTRVLMPLNLYLQPTRGQRSFVMTRLHARYDAASLGEDLVFREAPGIANGSQGGDGPFIQAAVPSPSNRFQGRFIIRHPWTGQIACQDPVRGVYGGPPAGHEPSRAKPVTDAAFAPRDGTDPSKCVEEPIAALAAPLAATPATPALQSSPPPAPESPPPAPPTETTAGCGCRTDVAPTSAFLFLLLALSPRRRCVHQHTKE